MCIGIFGLVCVFLLIGVGGPLYHDCEHHHDVCTTHRSYGLCCQDYCWHGHTGPGGMLVLLLVVGVALVLILGMRSHRRRRRTYYDDYDGDSDGDSGF